jgi:hypothetical protein
MRFSSALRRGRLSGHCGGEGEAELICPTGKSVQRRRPVCPAPFEKIF